MSNIETLEDKINILRRFDPQIEGREQLIEDILEATSPVGKSAFLGNAIEFIFSWADSLWLRRSLITLSLAMILFFASQQFTIINRIGNLEKRMVESNTDQILKQQGENVILNSVLLKQAGSDASIDSIVVADRDLFQLIEAYSELQKRYQELQRKSRQEKVPLNVKL